VIILSIVAIIAFKMLTNKIRINYDADKKLWILKLPTALGILSKEHIKESRLKRFLFRESQWFSSWKFKYLIEFEFEDETIKCLDSVSRLPWNNKNVKNFFVSKEEAEQIAKFFNVEYEIK